MRRLFACLLVLALAAPIARAQDDQMDPKAMEEMMTQLMTPGDQHALLATMAGQWNTTMVSYQEGPEPVTTHGTFTSEPVLGGRYMLGRYEGTAMGMPFEGLSIDGYDKGKQEFFSIWLDNFGTSYYIARGQLAEDGRTLTHSGTIEFGPMQVPSRSRTVMKDDDTVVFTMWHTMGGVEAKAMELTYNRTK
jgi:hypothetical protein